MGVTRSAPVATAARAGGTMSERPRPTPDELAAADGRTVPDVAAPGLRVLFCGINPGLWSAAVGLHFARPGNRFWKVLHGAGFTAQLMDPADQQHLLERGVGITNLVERATASADQLTRDELRAGARALQAKVRALHPAWVAVVGMQAYRVAFGRPHAGVGRQPEDLAGAGLWLLPNPSGLQAHYQLPELTAAFAELRRASGVGVRTRGGRGRTADGRRATGGRPAM